MGYLYIGTLSAQGGNVLILLTRNVKSLAVVVDRSPSDFIYTGNHFVAGNNALLNSLNKTGTNNLFKLSERKMALKQSTH